MRRGLSAPEEAVHPMDAAAPQGSQNRVIPEPSSPVGRVVKP